MPPEGEYVEVVIQGVIQDPSDRSVVLLRDDRDRQLQIWIGQCEAVAIRERLDPEFEPQRPRTQDLALNLWKRLDGTLRSLRIDDFWEAIFYSKLTVEQNGEAIDIDCRPSDGLALALTAKVPIFVADEVMENVGRTDRDEDDRPEE